MTAATLALRPLVAAGVIETAGIVVDTLTGITGAGRTPTDTNVFTNVDSNVFAYGLLDHRHTPEMEQEIGATLLFTPHIVPMSRGLLATCYAQPTGACSTDDVLDIAAARSTTTSRSSRCIDAPPATKSVLGSNAAHVSARYRRTHRHGDRDVRDRQPDQGRVRRRRPGGERRARPRRDGRTHHDRTRTVSDTVVRTRRTPALKAATLVEALPYIRRFAGKTVVVKYGGNALAGTSDHDALAVVRRGHRADAPRRDAARSSCTAAVRRSPI